MATGGVPPEESGLLSSRDEVPPRLLKYVASHLDHKEQESFALEAVRLTQNDLSCIEVDFPDNSKRRNYHILKKWYDHTPRSMTVGPFMKKLVTWQRAGYLSNDVWSGLDEYVISELIPPRSETQAPSGGDDPKPTRTEYIVPNKKEAKHLQDRAKRSIERQYRQLECNDWLGPDQAKSVPLKENYVNLKWTKVVKGLKNAEVNISTIYDILKILDSQHKPEALNILIEAEPGMGKTWSIALLALNWAKGEEDTDARLASLDFVFQIRLRNIKQILSLAETIIDQHDKIGINKDKEYLTAILEGQTDHRVMILMDGYDEYTPGTNSDIDKAIDSTVGECLIILTSRPGYLEKKIKAKLDGEIMIKGLSLENIKKFSKLNLLSDEEIEAMLDQARKSGINNILHVPIILRMVCEIFRENKSLPKTQTGIFGTIFNLIIGRATKSSKIPDLDHLLYKLGEFSWKALQNDVQQLILNKNDLDNVSPDIMKLGLLFKTEIDVVSYKERPTYVTFHHKLLQEYSAAYYISKCVERNENKEELCRTFFPNTYDIKKHKEVILFASGLMADPAPLIHHVYQLYILKTLQETMAELKILRRYDYQLVRNVWQDMKRLLHAFYTESKVPLPGTPYNNQYINFTDPSSESITQLYVPSQLYWLGRSKKDVRFTKYATTQQKGLECAVFIDEEGHTSLLSTVCEISQQQPVTHLYIKDYEMSGDYTLNVSDNAVFISISGRSCHSESIVHLAGLSSCRNLRFLHLEKQHVRNLESCNLETMKSLEELRLKNIQLVPKFAKKVCKQFRYLVNLRKLDFSRCRIGTSCRYITEAVECWGPNHPLTHVNLNNCEIPTDLLLTLICALSKCKQLTRLDISCNKGVDIDKDRKESDNLEESFPCLESLRVSHCDLPPWFCGRLLASLSKSRHLSYLDLSGNRLTGVLHNFLSDESAELPDLANLHLQSTHLTLADSKHLALIMENNRLPALSCLDLGYNGLILTPRVLRVLSRTILRHLLLSGNTLTGNLRYLLDDQSNLTRGMRWLHLKSTNLNRDDLDLIKHLENKNKHLYIDI